MLPITGPFNVTRGNDYFYEVKVWSRQKRPFDLPLAFNHSRGYWYGTPSTSAANRFRNFCSSENGYRAPTAYNKAYERLLDQLGESASLGLNLAQYGQARDMVNKRGSQLLAFGSALAKRSPIGVAAALGISAKRCREIMRTKHGVSRSLADLWLEFWFGWKPAVSDIYSACQVFDNELEWSRLRARSGKIISPMTVYQAPGPWSEGIKWRGETTCLIGADLRVTNPNVRLLESFGLLNLASIGVDAVPWSFVVGWFSNLNTYLSSLTALAGIETRGAFMTETSKIWGELWWRAESVNSIWNRNGNGDGHGVLVKRTLLKGIPRPRLLFDAKRFQPTRGATAISLLVQKLPRK